MNFSRSFTLAVSVLSTTAHAADGPTFTPHAALHIRPEVRVNPSFVADQDDTIVSVQESATIGLIAERGPFSATIDMMAYQNWGNRTSTTGVEPTVFAYQAFLQAGTKDHWVRVGRQELHMLNGFYLSRGPWNTVGRTFDGIRLHAKPGDWELDAFTMVLRAPHPADESWRESSLGDSQMGVFASHTASKGLQPSLFVLGTAGGPTEDDPQRKKWTVTPGTRIAANVGQTSVDANLLGQWGDDSGTPIRAWSTIVRVRQGLGAAWKPGVSLLFEQDSGHACESDPSSGACTTDTIRDFEGPFGRNHYLRGAADQMNNTNLRDIGLSADSTPWSKGGGDGKKPSHAMLATVEGHLFQLANPEGQWKRNGGVLQGDGWKTGNTDPNLAIEVDAILDFTLGPSARIDSGLCWVQPIGVGAELTGEDAMTYLFVRNRFNF